MCSTHQVNQSVGELSSSIQPYTRENSMDIVNVTFKACDAKFEEAMHGKYALEFIDENDLECDFILEPDALKTLTDKGIVYCLDRDVDYITLKDNIVTFVFDPEDLITGSINYDDMLAMILLG